MRGSAACEAIALTMIARAIPRTGPRRSRLLYVDDHAESMARLEQLLARRKDLLLVRAGSLDLALKQASSIVSPGP